MNTADGQVKGWAQQSMLPPEHVKIEVTIHWEASTGASRMGVHVSDLITEEVLAIWDRPLRPLLKPGELAIITAGLLAGTYEEHCHPF